MDKLLAGIYVLIIASFIFFAIAFIAVNFGLSMSLAWKYILCALLGVVVFTCGVMVGENH